MALTSLLKRQTLPETGSARQQRFLDAISWSLLLKQMEGSAGGGTPSDAARHAQRGGGRLHDYRDDHRRQQGDGQKKFQQGFHRQPD